MLTRTSIHSARQKQSGVALILCLILAAVFAAISVYTSEKEQQQIRIFTGLQEKVEQQYLAHTLTETLNYSILTNKPFTWVGKKYQLNGFGDPMVLPHPNAESGSITLTIQDALGLLSISRPEASMLSKLIDKLADDNKRGQTVMDTWFDWEDFDNLARNSGKELDEDLDVPYRPRNGKMQTLSELRLLASMDATLFNKLSPHLIYTSYINFSPKLASNELRRLLDLPELADEARTNAFSKLQNGLYVEQKHSFKIALTIQGEYARFQREYVVTYRPDEIRLVSISEFGD